MICCHFKSICNRTSIVTMMGTFTAQINGKLRMHACVNRTCSSKARKSPEPGPVIIRAGNHLAILCLVFGAAFATFASGSFEQRIGNFLSFGLIPAVGLYAGAHLLGQLLIFGVELCDMIIARCSRYAIGLAKRFLALGRHAYLELVDRRQPDQPIPAELKPRNPLRSQSTRLRTSPG
jgi:hypothetical protein